MRLYAPEMQMQQLTQLIGRAIAWRLPHQKPGHIKAYGPRSEQSNRDLDMERTGPSAEVTCIYCICDLIDCPPAQ